MNLQHYLQELQPFCSNTTPLYEVKNLLLRLHYISENRLLNRYMVRVIAADHLEDI